MYALDQDLARRRLMYPRLLPTLPDIMVIDIPGRFAAVSLPLGRYYPIMVETECEKGELDLFLTRRRAGPVAPDLLDHRETQLATYQITMASYSPPLSGWPFVLLCHWPKKYTVMALEQDVFARGAYTVEMFESAEELYDAAAFLLEVLERGGQVATKFIAPVQNCGTA